MEPTGTELNAGTRYCAVYGHPIRHSASPAMQNAGIAALGLDWRYLAFDVHPQDLAQAMAGASAMRFIGLNLTVPHKLLAVDLVDLLDQSAQKWGAVNTVRFEGRKGGGEWAPLRCLDPMEVDEVRSVGFNTDADAIAHAVEEEFNLRLAGSKVLLLGAGGAGRTTGLRLAESGAASLYLVNRTRSKAEELAREINCRYPGVSCSIEYPSHPVDLLINATSLGLSADDPLPLAQEKFDIRDASHVYDMIYRPAETPLIKLAKAAGCRAANGTGMLLHQGAKALEIWTGKAPPIDEMRHALHSHLHKAAK